MNNLEDLVDTLIEAITSFFEEIKTLKKYTMYDYPMAFVHTIFFYHQRSPYDNLYSYIRYNE